MSAPQTNVEKQERRHRGPLIGMALALAAVAVLAFVFLAEGGDEVTGVPTDAGGALTEGEAAPPSY
jgi:hypothetical protein